MRPVLGISILTSAARSVNGPYQQRQRTGSVRSAAAHGEPMGATVPRKEQGEWKRRVLYFFEKSMRGSMIM